MLLHITGGGVTAFILSRSGSALLEGYLERHGLRGIRVLELGRGRALAELHRTSQSRRVLRRLPRISWREVCLEIFGATLSEPEILQAVGR